MIDRGTLYIYNLKTGETVGIKKDKDVEGAEKTVKP